jgi:hypothetical protein
LAASTRSDFCTFDQEFSTILDIGHLQPEFQFELQTVGWFARGLYQSREDRGSFARAVRRIRRARVRASCCYTPPYTHTALLQYKYAMMRVMATLLATAVACNAGPSAPERLRVEYMEEPMGVDVSVRAIGRRCVRSVTAPSPVPRC